MSPVHFVTLQFDWKNNLALLGKLESKLKELADGDDAYFKVYNGTYTVYTSTDSIPLQLSDIATEGNIKDLGLTDVVIRQATTYDLKSVSYGSSGDLSDSYVAWLKKYLLGEPAPTLS